MNKKIRTAIVGYGNIGKYTVDALKAAPDMELVGVVRRSCSMGSSQPPELSDVQVVSSIADLQEVKVALLCTPSRTIPEYAREILTAGINTVDSYDIHTQLADHRLELDNIARQHNCVAVVSAGWDPGTDSMIRCIFEFMAPKGITYTNFGPGMSMGHSVAVKSIAGVREALSMTIPLGTGVHRRLVYVQLEPDADFSAIEKAIKDDPYFVNDDTRVSQVEDVKQLIDMGHGVLMERKGVSGSTHNQLLKFSMQINNPALTAQVMVAAARASVKQQPGAYTMIQIPIIDYMYGNPEEIIRKYV